MFEGIWVLLQVYQTKMIPNPQSLTNPIRIPLSHPSHGCPRALKLMYTPREIIKPNDRHSQHYSISANKPAVQCPTPGERSILIAFGEGTPDGEYEDCLEGFDVAGDVQ